MKINKTTILFLLGILVPCFFVFKFFFIQGPLTWGDAPFFYSEGLNALVKEAYGWTNINQNFGGVNLFIWIWPIMFCYGLLHHLFGFGNDFLIRIFFYFPSVFFSLLSGYLFSKYLRLSKAATFFVTLFYCLNTYFLLLIDGGTVGVALAYGLFPQVLYRLKKYLDKPDLTHFFTVLIFVFVLGVIDLRVALICLIAVTLWFLLEKIIEGSIKSLGNIKRIVPLLICFIGLGLYWIIPLFAIKSPSLSLDVTNLRLLSLINPLFLFQPHWYQNIFGRVNLPSLYFAGIPILVFSGVLLSKNKKHLALALIFLVFSFLAKGSSAPLGFLYDFVIGKIPFGNIFRDSSRFLIPVFLFGAALIGVTVDKIVNYSSRKKIRKFILLGLIYFYLLFTIFPALSGRLNWNLSLKKQSSDFEKIYRNLKKENVFFRSLWFPEKNSLSFGTEENPAVDAKSLVDNRPFSSINVGSYDRFNFMNWGKYEDWFGLLGIKYLVFPNDPRKIEYSENEKKDWQNLLSLVGKNKNFQKVDWGTDFPVYSLKNIQPRIFGVEKTVLVVGPDDIFQKLDEAGNNFSRANQGFLFLEDGKLNPLNLLDPVSSNSAVLVLNNRGRIDLTLAFLQKYFSDSFDTKNTQWKIWKPEEYLKWKFELLIHGIDTKDFDYGRKIAFSSVTNEDLAIKLPVKKNGEYLLAIRYMSGSDSSGLNFNFHVFNEDIKNKKANVFEWYITDPLELNKGNYVLKIRNIKGSQVVNVVALIPVAEWKKAERNADELINKFQTYDVSEASGFEKLVSVLGNQKWREVPFTKSSPTWYKTEIPKNINWLIFTDSYHKDWKLLRGLDYLDSYPLYSMVNGFYVRPQWEKVEIVFKGQQFVRWGTYLSGIFVLILLIVYIRFKKNDDN